MADNSFDAHDFIRHSLLNRRAALRGGLAFGAAAMAPTLAACSGDDQFAGGGSGGGQQSGPGPRAHSVSPTPRNETLVVDQADFTTFDSFNPFIPNGEQYNGGLGQVAKEYLWYFNLATGEITPWLATDWEYGDDFREFVMHLNPRAHWNDGTPFTSKDVKFTMEMLQGDESLLGRGVATGDAEAVETPDDQTVVIKLNTSNPRYHYNWICGIVGAEFVVVPEHVWSGENPADFKNNPPVFTGPYKFSEAMRDLKMFVWEKDPEYWNKDELDPAPKYVVYRSTPPPDAAIQEFTQGATDVGSGLYELITAAVEDGYENAIITSMTDPCPRAIWMNCDPSRGALADPRMRWAISALIDRDRIAQSIWPVETVAATFPWPEYPNNEAWENQDIADEYPLSYDPDRATALLDELGATADGNGRRSYEGEPISLQILTTAQDPDAEYLIAQMVGEELKSVGIETDVRTLSASVYEDRKRMGDFDLLSEWLCGELYDPWQVYEMFSTRYYVPVGESATESNMVRLQDDALDDATARLSQLSPEEDEAQPIFDDGLQAWFEAMPVIPTIQTVYTHQFNTTYWTGWPTDDDLYQVPNNWWGQFMFVIGNLQPTGEE